MVTRVVDLTADLALGYEEDGPRNQWVLLRTDLIPPPPYVPGSIDPITGLPIEPPGPPLRPRQLETSQRPQDLEVVAGTLTEILEGALASGGALPTPQGPFVPRGRF